MVILTDKSLLCGLQLEKNIARKERLLEHDGFAPILVRRTAAGQRRGDALPLALLGEFIFPSGPRVRHKPRQFWHEPEDSGQDSRCQSELAGFKLAMSCEPFCSSNGLRMAAYLEKSGEDLLGCACSLSRQPVLKARKRAMGQTIYAQILTALTLDKYLGLSH